MNHREIILKTVCEATDLKKSIFSIK